MSIFFTKPRNSLRHYFLILVTQIVWGFYIGCNYDNWSPVNVEEAMAFAEHAKSMGLGMVSNIEKKI